MSSLNRKCINHGITDCEKCSASPTKSEECKCHCHDPRHLNSCDGCMKLTKGCPHCQKQEEVVNKQNKVVKQLSSNQDQPAEWESEFDDYWFISEKRTRGSTNAHRYEVKAFIKVLLSQQKQNLIREVEKKQKEVDCMDVDASEKEGYNEAIKDFLSLLKGESR